MIKSMTRVLTTGAALAAICTASVFAQTPAAAPAAGAPAAAEEGAPPAPVLPTTGDGAVVVKVLSDVCKPLVEGRGDFDQLATAAGMTKDKTTGDYVKQLSQRPFQI